MKQNKRKTKKKPIVLEIKKTYSAPREYLTGDEEYELQLIREREIKEKI